MKKHFKLIRILISLVILVLLFRKIEFNALLNQFANLKFWVVWMALAILFVQCAISSYKWQAILTAEGRSTPFAFLLKSYLIGNFISLFLPSSFGGDLYRIYALKEYNRDYFQNTSSVLFDRITGLFALMSISIFSLAIFYRQGIDFRFIAGYLCGVCVFLICTSEKIINLLDRNKSNFIQFPKRIFVSFSRYRKNTRVLLVCLFISFVFQTNIVLLNKLYCSALGIDIELSYLFMVIPLIYLTEVLPLSINGFGLREGAFVFFFIQAGYAAEQGLAAGLLVISMRYVFSIATGGTLFFREMLKNRNIRGSKEPAI